MMKNSIYIFCIGILLIFLELIILKYFDFIFYNTIMLYFLTDFIFVILWVNKNQKKEFKILNSITIVSLTLLILECLIMHNSLILQILYIVAFYYYLKLEFFVTEINIRIISLFIVFFSFIGIFDLLVSMIINSNMIEFNLTVFYYFLMQIALNSFIVLIMYKIFKNREILLYN